MTVLAEPAPEDSPAVAAEIEVALEEVVVVVVAEGPDSGAADCLQAVAVKGFPLGEGLAAGASEPLPQAETQDSSRDLRL